MTPGVGLLWFAVRREWRPLAVAAGGSALVALASAALDSTAWVGWLASVTATAAGSPLNQFSIPIPLLPRLVAAAAIVTWGARTDRR